MVISPHIFQILLISMTDYPIIGVALCLIHLLGDNSATLGGERKGGKQYRQTSTIYYRLSSRCQTFISPFPPPPNTSTRLPPPLLTASVAIILMLYPHPPCRNQSLPSPNPTQSSPMFYGRCRSKIWSFFSLNKLASPTENTWEALQCVRYHQNTPESESRPIKVLTLVCAKKIV